MNDFKAILLSRDCIILLFWWTRFQKSLEFFGEHADNAGLVGQYAGLVGLVGQYAGLVGQYSS